MLLGGDGVGELETELELLRRVQHRVQQEAHERQTQLPQQRHLVRARVVSDAVLCTIHNALKITLEPMSGKR